VADRYWCGGHVIPYQALQNLLSHGYALLDTHGCIVTAVKHLEGRDRYVVLEYVDNYFRIIVQ
jgi:hypothetical protein